MIHYSCDRCGREIETEEEVRYIVQISMEPVFDLGSPEDMSDDVDHLDDVDVMLQHIEDEELSCDEIFFKKQFDLCSDCHRKVARNPLGKDIGVSFGFSKN